MRVWIAAYRTEPFWAVPLGVLATLAVCGLYHAYRYPLRINSTATSPTYSDTQTSLQVGKYALLAAIAAGVALFALSRFPRAAWRPTRRDWILAAVAVFAFGRAAFGAWRSDSVTALDIVGPIVAVVPIALLAALWFSLRPGAVPRFAGHWLWFAIGLLVLNTFVNVVEILVWKTTGRLPALGYEGGLVRFGGVWDDPNSSAVYAGALALFLLSGRVDFSLRWRLFLGWCALFNVAVAWSYSSWVLITVGLAVLFAARFWRPAIALAALGTAILIGVALVPNPTAPGTGVNVVPEEKKESAAQRLESEAYFDPPTNPLSWIIGEDAPRAVENAFGNWFTATGLIGCLGLAAWVLLAIQVLWRTVERRWLLAVLAGAGVSSLFVPHLTVFPVGAFLVLALALTASYYERAGEQGEAAGVRDRVVAQPSRTRPAHRLHASSG